MIKRSQTKHILELLRFNPVVAILGPRQVGKTTLAGELRKLIGKKSIMLDMENPDDYLKMDNAGFYLKNFEEYCVIIDEVQIRPELFSLLRVLVDKKRKPARFILLGSADPVIIKGTSESLAGRISFVELHPFDILEVPAKYLNNAHWFYGGFPKSILGRKKSDSLKWLDDFITTYIERDLPGIGLQTSSQNLRRFWTMLAHSQGGIWNASMYAKSLGISPPTISKYLDFLERSFIIRKLHPYYANIKKQLVKSPKVYIRDSGILHRLLRINEYTELLGNSISGFSWEGYVIEQVINLKNDSIEISYFRTKDGTECDLIFTKASKPIACAEIKFSNSPVITKSLRITQADLKMKNSYIITPSSEDYLMSENTRVCSLYDFVTKHLPKLK